MILSILIPTYNRSEFLIKNIELLFEYVEKLPINNEVEIIVSNNCSPDNTDDVLKGFIEKKPNFNIKYFQQSKNIGLQANALFVLDKSDAEYVMYLGDDDFIDFEYLEGVLEHIYHNNETFTIIPSFYPIDVSGKRLGLGRDNGFSSQIFSAGILNCFINSYRGHQLSGLVLKREGLLKEYLNKKVNNIYPFIFFVSYNCLRGNTYHFTQYPVRVTQPGQDAKDWTYGEDGLFNEIFDNYDKLEINSFQKTKLQLKFYKIQSWRLWSYEKMGAKALRNAFLKIWLSQNGTLLFKFVFPIQVARLKLYQELRKILR